MVVFSSKEAAKREGFQVVDFNREVGMYVVERDCRRPDGRRVKTLAYAREGDSN